MKQYFLPSIFILFVIALGAVLGVLPNGTAKADPVTFQQPQGKVWSRTQVKVGNAIQDIVTVESKPGVICTYVMQADRSGTANVSCVNVN